MLMLLPIFSVAQVFQTFQRSIGGNDDDEGQAIRQTSDGGYILTGFTKSFGAGNRDFYLIKTDDIGNVTWSRVYGGNDDDRAYSVEQTTDGGYIVCGYTKSFGAGDDDLFLVKTDATGAIVWTSTFGNNKDDHGYYVQQTSDGGYIAAGYTDDPAGGLGDDDFFLVKTDATGNLEWNKHYGDNDDEVAYCVQQTTDGGFVLCGETKSYGLGNDDIYVVKTDNMGNVQYSGVYGDNDEDLARSIRQTADGGFILTGETKSFGVGGRAVIVMKLTSTLNHTWTKTYEGANDDRGHEIQLLNNGLGYVVVGRTKSFGQGGEDAFLLQIDLNGAFVRASAYGQNNNQLGYSCVNTADNGFALTGETKDNTNGGDDFYFVKTDSLGVVSCDETPFIPTVTSQFPNVSTGAGVYTLASTSNPVTTNTAPPTGNQLICFNCTLTGTYVQTNVSCNGGSDGAASVTTIGGTLPYSYFWTPSGSVASFDTTLTAGLHVVTTTDALGCTHLDSILITEPALPLSIANTFTQHVACFGDSTGQAEVLASGGTTPYFYSWNTVPAQDSSAALNLLAGTYVSTVTDSNGCVSSLPVTINEQPMLMADITTASDVSCNGGNDGSATVGVTGGTLPYTYNWIPSGGTAATATNLAPGVYVVVVTDGNSCTTTDTVIIAEPPALGATTSESNATCFGLANGSSNVVASGGTPGYTYSWSTGGVSSIENNIAAGNHTVTVTDFNGCQIVIPFVISQPSGMTITSSVTESTCGNSNGVITSNVSGGSPAYSYSWSTSPVQTSATATNLQAGVYTVTVTDVNGCMDSLVVNLNDIGGPAVSISGSTDVLCFGDSSGTATSNAVGGTPPLSYSWSPVGGTGVNGIGLPAGMATITVTDNNGCVGNASVLINEPTPLSASISHLDVNCFGGVDGSAQVAAANGTPPYNYNWSPSGGTNASAIGLSAGIYNCTITDDNGCSITVIDTIFEPQALSATTVGSSNVSCNGGNDGSASVAGIDGTPGYSYNWSPFGGTLSTASGLTAGNYVVEVTDNNGCEYNHNVSISEPVALSAGLTITNPSCAGATDGTITANVSLGTPPYSYFWSPIGGTTNQITNLGAGNYSVLITDNNGCQLVADTVLNNPGALTLFTSSTSANCASGADGTASVVASSGTPGYTYLWNTTPSQTTATAVAGAGVYLVTVTDANSCQAQASVEITEPNPMNISVGSLSNVSCMGGNDGAVTVVVSGGNGGFTYNWTPTGGTGPTASGLAAGNYQLYVTDSKGCVDSLLVTITEPSSSMSVTTSATSASCNGQADGVGTAMVVGGTPGYSYFWSGGGGSGSSSVGLPAGNYTVTVTDFNGCQATGNVLITEPGAISSSMTTTNVFCAGGADGAITIAVSGGTPPYNYNWSPGGAVGPTVNSLSAGTYTSTVIDSNGCLHINSVSITEPSALDLSLISSSPVTCNGDCDGTAQVQISGGVGPYVYNWFPGGQSSTSVNNLCAGNYTFTVEDFNNCIDSVTVSISEPDSITATISTANVSCGGACDGSATVVYNGGAGPYNIVWSPGPYTGPTVTGLCANNYSVNVLDANGCERSDNFSILEPTPLLLSSSTSSSSCGLNDGGACVSVAGGVIPYSFQWNDPGFQTDSCAVNLSAGSYTVTVMDFAGCIDSLVVNVNDVSGPNISITDSTHVTCAGASDGTVTANIAGGILPYDIIWSPGGQTTSFINALDGGVHTITVTDGNGCTTSRSVSINEPTSLLTAITNVSHGSCFLACDGGATVVAGGGVSPYTYLWNNSAAQTDSNALDLCDNTYTVTVTDANGCVAQDSITITEPTVIDIQTLALNNLTCAGSNDGEIQVSVSGGMGAYTYNWTPSVGTGPFVQSLTPGNYTLEVTDANGCTAAQTFTITEPAPLSLNVLSLTTVTCANGADGEINMEANGGYAPYNYQWSPTGGNGATASGLSAGNYLFTVVDSVGCSKDTTIVMTMPGPLTLTVLSQTDIDCAGTNTGEASVLGGAGTAPYTYQWSPSGSSGSSVNGLFAGVHTVFLEDANGCQLTDSLVIEEPDSIVVSTSNVNVTCNGGSDGSLMATVTGGTGTYNYFWSPGSVNTAVVNGVSAGTYSVVVTDALGCQGTAFDIVTEPSPVVASTSSTPVTCNSLSDGIGSVSGSGGTPGYTYFWSGGGGSASSSTGLPAGNYSVTVTDFHGCQTVSTVTITEPAVLSVVVAPDDVSCNGASNGGASATASGGTAPYTYSWMPSGAASAAVSGLAAGPHSVTVTDSNGCVHTESVTITEPTALSLSLISILPVTCNGDCDGAAQIQVAGGVAPYMYSWAPGGQSSTSVNNLCAGTHIFTVTDFHGCSDSIQVVITEPNAITSSITTTNVSCGGACDGSATVVYSGGVGPYDILWTPGLQTTPTVNGLCADIYSVNTIDANGCEHSDIVSITEPTPLVLTATSNPSNCGAADGDGCVSVNGGLAPYSILWNDPSSQSTSCATNLSASSYTVFVSDSAGCTDSIIVNVNDIQGPTVTITDSSDVTCSGDANGTAAANITGGIMPYDILWSAGGQTTSFASGLTGGIHTISVTDANGCITSASVSIYEPPLLVTAITAVNDNTCNQSCDGSATVIAGGGVAPYTYSWNTVVPQTANTALNLCAGNYTVTVIDSNGCTAQNNALITEPDLLEITTIAVNDVQCNGFVDGSIQVSVTGGSPTYSYLWTPGVGSGPLVTSLAPGNYDLEVADANGCTAAENFTVNEPAPIVLSVSTVGAFCGLDNGSAEVLAGGGVAPYSYQWDDINMQTTNVATDLFAGNYSVVVTDAVGCQSSVSTTVTGTMLFSIDSVVTNPVICHGTTTGSAEVFVSNGTSPYSYQWDDPNNQITSAALALEAGTYQVTVSDASGCVDSLSVVVTEPGPLNTIISATVDTICPGQSSQLFANGTGGTLPYTYFWSPTSFVGVGPHTVSPSGTTTYFVYSVDANGCQSSTVNTTVVVNPALQVSVPDVQGCNGDSISLSALATGGSGGPYTYSWNTGAGGSTTSFIGDAGLSPQIIIVTVSDGCSVLPVSDTSIVTIDPQPDIDFTSSTTSGCVPLTVNFEAASALATTFEWDFGDSTGVGNTASVSHTYFSEGTYDVTLIGYTAAGCSTSYSMNNLINVYGIPIANFEADPALVELPNSNVQFINHSVDGVSYLWDFDDDALSTAFEPDHFFTEIGSYNVMLVVSNGYGCSDTAINVVEVTGGSLFPTAFTPNANGSNGGSYDPNALHNDIFFPFVKGVDEFHLSIFNRWGELIFETNDVSIGWDGFYRGEIVQQGMYVWKVDITFTDGRNYKNSGDITVLR